MLPELAKSCHPVFGRVPGDDRAVDRADRDAGGSVRLIIAFGQRLVDPGLIRVERAISLGGERDLLVHLTSRIRSQLFREECYVLQASRHPWSPTAGHEMPGIVGLSLSC